MVLESLVSLHQFISVGSTGEDKDRGRFARTSHIYTKERRRGRTIPGSLDCQGNGFVDPGNVKAGKAQEVRHVLLR